MQCLFYATEGNKSYRSLKTDTQHASTTEPDLHPCQETHPNKNMSDCAGASVYFQFLQHKNPTCCVSVCHILAAVLGENENDVKERGEQTAA